MLRPTRAILQARVSRKPIPLCLFCAVKLFHTSPHLAREGAAAYLKKRKKVLEEKRVKLKKAVNDKWTGDAVQDFKTNVRKVIDDHQVDFDRTSGRRNSEEDQATMIQMAKALPLYALRQQEDGSYRPMNNTIKLVGNVTLNFHTERRMKDTSPAYSNLYARFMKDCFTKYLSTRTADDLPPRTKAVDMYCKYGLPGVDAFLKQAFREYMLAKVRLPFEQPQFSTMDVADKFKHPAEWFPNARATKRTWHLHIGPTNSGKTYNALKRLEQSKSGCYAGPLRLLAHEVFDRLNAKGIPCNLATGEEVRIISPECQKVSCTVEMANLDRQFDIAVIDEIQMLEDRERGFAWTFALLGLQAKEIHICGEVRAREIVEKLAKLCGDELIVHEYERLSPLKLAEAPLMSLLDLRKGDCLIAFSRKKIYRVKHLIESRTNLKCAIVYGGLPPETRAQQARLFNDPNNDIDILVASDAVGMGLNLSIHRVIFTATMKFDGKRTSHIPVPQVLQIAGRAGRFKTSHEESTELKMQKELELNPENTETEPIRELGPLPPSKKIGYVTVIDPENNDERATRDMFRSIKKLMSLQPRKLEVAGIQPDRWVVEKFAAGFPEGTHLLNIIHNLFITANAADLFTMSSLEAIKENAEVLDDIEGLLIKDRYTLCCAPVKLSYKPRSEAVYLAYAKAIANQEMIGIQDIDAVNIEILDKGVPNTPEGISDLEEVHQQIMLYMWLVYRFPYIFGHQEIARGLKTECERLIHEGLEAISNRNASHSPTFYMEKGRKTEQPEHQVRLVSTDAPPDEWDSENVYREAEKIRKVQNDDVKVAYKMEMLERLKIPKPSIDEQEEEPYDEHEDEDLTNSEYGYETNRSTYPVDGPPQFENHRKVVNRKIISHRPFNKSVNQKLVEAVSQMPNFFEGIDEQGTEESGFSEDSEKKGLEKKVQNEAEMKELKDEDEKLVSKDMVSETVVAEDIVSEDMVSEKVVSEVVSEEDAKKRSKKVTEKKSGKKEAKTNKAKEAPESQNPLKKPLPDIHYETTADPKPKGKVKVTLPPKSKVMEEFLDAGMSPKAALASYFVDKLKRLGVGVKVRPGEAAHFKSNNSRGGFSRIGKKHEMFPVSYMQQNTLDFENPDSAKAGGNSTDSDRPLIRKTQAHVDALGLVRRLEVDPPGLIRKMYRGEHKPLVDEMSENTKHEAEGRDLNSVANKSSHLSWLPPSSNAGN